MTEFRKLRGQGADRAAVALDVGAVGNQHVNEAADAIPRLFSIRVPSIQHPLGVDETLDNQRVQDVVLGLEVVIEVAARDLYVIRDVRERSVLVALTIEQVVGGFDDLVAGGLVAHDRPGGLGRSSKFFLGQPSKSVKQPRGWSHATS